MAHEPLCRVPGVAVGGRSPLQHKAPDRRSHVGGGSVPRPDRSAGLLGAGATPVFGALEAFDWVLAVIKNVENRLEPHDSSENISALQGSSYRASDWLDIIQRHPSPTERLITGSAGAGLVAYGLLGRKDAIGYGLSAAGGLLVLRAAVVLAVRHNEP